MEIGLEKEMLVFDENYKPRNYKVEELTNSFTVDFANNQVELVSDVHDNIPAVINQMYNLLNEDKIIKNNLWPLSQPGLSNYKVEYGALGKEAKEYRQFLYEKYGTDYMNISGIHFNFSYNKEKNHTKEYYFNLMKKIYVYSPLMLQFFAFTPFYENNINDKNLKTIGKNKGLKNSLSLRNTLDYGYLNEGIFNFDYTSYESYKKSIDDNINEGNLIDFREVYSKIRVKEVGQKTYLELRYIDLNPFTRLGITFEQMTLLKLMINYIKDINVENINISIANKEFDKVALSGVDKTIEVEINNKVDTLYNHTISFLKDIKKKLELKENESHIINEFLKKYSEDDLDINRFINKINEESLSIKEYGMKYSFKKEVFKPLYEGKKLELSTKILMKQAQDSGVEVQVLDEVENVIALTKNNQKEIVVQATKTNKDTYANILMMENKVMTKKILQENKINVPKGQVLLDKEEVNYNLFQEHKMVIKPVDTNFGLGITILEKEASKEQINKALDFAFKYGKRIIVEEFFQGTEYRFLVIDDELVSIVKRIPANVKGDGIHTVKELVEIKNKNPLRSKGYVTPVEYLKITEIEKDYLKLQGLTEDSIIEQDKIIYLRENSNVSTGGDSEEVFCKIPNYFKEIAVKAVKALDVKICGIDMIIDDKYNHYTIIEANFNPAIQMHTYPYYGLGKDPSPKILDLLFK